MDTRARAEQAVREFLERANRDPEPILDTSLYAEGLGLDSLETAELSAYLEDEVGTDPFSEGLLPQTVGELLDFYSGRPADVDRG